MSERTIECKNHGVRYPAFVCQHLNLSYKVGFYEPELEEGEEIDDLNAWCNECEKVRQLEGGWNEVSESFAKIKLICDKCFFDMKELNF